MRLFIPLLWPGLLAAAFLAVGRDDAQAARKDPVAGLRASINELFSPPRRSRRAKTKTVRPSGSAAGREPAEPKASPSKASLRKGPAAEPVAPVRATGPDKPGRGERTAARPKAEPRPAALPARRDAHRDIGGATRPPPTKRAFGDPPTTTGSASDRPGARTAAEHERPQRQDGRMAALPPPTKQAPSDPDKEPDAEPEAAPPPPPSACQQRFAAGESHAIASIQPRLTAGQCVVDDVVRLEAVIDKDGRRITVAPAALLQCPMAEALVQWLRDDVAAAARELGADLKTVTADTSFECRSRNHVKGAKLSEHGHANAIDLRAVTLTNGTAFHFTDVNADRPARESLRKSACTRFTTVLGPGSDGYHETHIHLDLAQRRSGYRICQWDVRDTTVAAVPLPPERPSAAPPRLAKSRR
jgi:hypothetical protein